MFLHSLAYLFQLGYKQPNAKYQIFYFQVYGNMVEENRMYQQLQKMCREKVCLKSFSDKISFALSKIACSTCAYSCSADSLKRLRELN